MARVTSSDEASASVRSAPGATGRPAEPVLSDAVIDALRANGLGDLRLIGRGAHSDVYRARDERLARDVAVKVIDASRASAADVARFEREVSIVAQLRHPHIVPLYDAGVAGDGSLFAVMPLASGQTLRELERTGPLPLRVVVSLAREIADALSYAHGRGIIHRDIKPENILIEDDHAVIADFGLAVPSGERQAPRPADLQQPVGDERITQAGTIVGTPLYASPEQLAGDAATDARTDVFALGAICYEMLTGRPPFRGATLRETIAARFRGPPPPMREAGVRVPAAVEAVILRALRSSPADRQPSARVFRDELTRAYLAHVRPAWRRAGVPVAILGAAAVVFGILWWASRSQRIETSRLDPRRVVVADLDNETADSAYAKWGDVAGDLVATRLAAVSGLQIVTSERWLARSQRRQRQPDSVSLQRVAAEVNAATVVSGGYYLDGGHVELVLEVTDARSGVLLRTYGPVAIPAQAPDSTVLTLGTHVAAALDTLLVLQRNRPTG
jgi:serine/threonine-protein kinase